jgi:uncharacterized protein YndB with AHSA1/START domain
MPRRRLSIDQTYFVHQPVSKVFRALSTPAGLSRWFLKSARLPREKGAKYEFVWQGGYRHTAKVLAFVPDRQLSLQWFNRARGRTLWTRATFSFRSVGNGTLLHLRHTGYPRSDPWVEVYGATQSGWAYFLQNLKSVLEHEHDLRSPREL